MGRNINRIYMLSALLLSLALCLSGCAGRPPQSEPPTTASEDEGVAKAPAAAPDYDGMAPDIARIVRRGYLTVAIPSEDIPLFFESDGYSGFKGFDIDTARELASGLGVEARFDRESKSFSQLTDKLKRGEADVVVSTYSMTKERAMYVSFSDPYLETYVGIFANKQQLVRLLLEHNPLDYMKSNPVRIGAEANTAHYELARELFPNAEIVACDNYAVGCDMVVSGDLFAFFSIDFAFMQLLESDPSLSLYANVYIFTDLQDQYCIGVSKDTPQLLSYVNTYLRTAKTVTYGQVAQAYRERYRGDAP